jgi:hypothetical protein
MFSAYSMKNPHQEKSIRVHAAATPDLSHNIDINPAESPAGAGQQNG